MSSRVVSCRLVDAAPLRSGFALCCAFQGERNFHILYELVAGGAAFGLGAQLKVREEIEKGPANHRWQGKG